jgi:transcriptional regulator with XRE-family HTH domain
LAERSAVSANTIDRFENGRNAPIPATLMALRQAFEAVGVTGLSRRRRARHNRRTAAAPIAALPSYFRGSMITP